MQYTQEQQDGFKDEFAARRKRQLLASLAVVPMLLIVFTADEKAGTALAGIPLAVVAPIAFLLIVGLLVFSFRNWRCPACEKYLGKGIGPAFCPKCGVALK